MIYHAKVVQWDMFIRLKSVSLVKIFVPQIGDRQSWIGFINEHHPHLTLVVSCSGPLPHWLNFPEDEKSSRESSSLRVSLPCLSSSYLSSSYLSCFLVSSPISSSQPHLSLSTFVALSSRISQDAPIAVELLRSALSLSAELFELGSLLPAGLFSRGSGFDLLRLTFAPFGRIRTPEKDTLEPLYSEFQL